MMQIGWIGWREALGLLIVHTAFLVDTVVLIATLSLVRTDFYSQVLFSDWLDERIL